MDRSYYSNFHFIIHSYFYETFCLLIFNDVFSTTVHFSNPDSLGTAWLKADPGENRVVADPSKLSIGFSIVTLALIDHT